MAHYPRSWEKETSSREKRSGSGRQRSAPALLGCPKPNIKRWKFNSIPATAILLPSSEFLPLLLFLRSSISPGNPFSIANNIQENERRNGTGKRRRTEGRDPVTMRIQEDYPSRFSRPLSSSSFSTPLSFFSSSSSSTSVVPATSFLFSVTRDPETRLEPAR